MYFHYGSVSMVMKEYVVLANEVSPMVDHCHGEGTVFVSGHSDTDEPSSQQGNLYKHVPHKYITNAWCFVLNPD